MHPTGDTTGCVHKKFFKGLGQNVDIGLTHRITFETSVLPL